MKPEEIKRLYNTEFKPLYSKILKGVTSISKETNDGVYAHGTGNYISYDNNVYLITNEHVVRDGCNSYLHHIPNLNYEYIRCANPFLTIKQPIDLGVMRTTEHFHENSKLPFQNDFDVKYQPVEGELFFWIGFPGTILSRHDIPTKEKTRTAYFETLNSPAVPFLTAIEKNFDKIGTKFLDEFHFALKYPEETKVNEEIIFSTLPNPQGLSGSFVWDTKYIKSKKEGINWNYNLAKICGILWYDNSTQNVLYATKIEKILTEMVGIHNCYDEAFLKFQQKGC